LTILAVFCIEISFQYHFQKDNMHLSCLLCMPEKFSVFQKQLQKNHKWTLGVSKRCIYIIYYNIIYIIYCEQSWNLGDEGILTVEYDRSHQLNTNLDIFCKHARQQWDMDL
jgi:hypothetical protein